MAELNFDASKVAPATGAPEAVPAGWYNVMMDESEMKPTKDGAGAFLQCRFNIADGQYSGRKLFSRLNLKNLNPVAVEIAYKELSAIAHAVGVIQVGTSEQLHNIPMKVKVKLRPATAEYEASNDVTAYRNINDPTAVNMPAGVGATTPLTGVAPIVVKQGVVTPPPAAAQGAWAGATGAVAQPWAAAPEPVPPVPVITALSVPTVLPFPPGGWLAHPSAPGYFYMGQEVLTEAQLRAKTAPTVTVVVPAAPVVTAQQAAPPWATMSPAP